MVLGREELSAPVRASSIDSVPLRGSPFSYNQTTRSSVTLASLEVSSGSSSQPCKLSGALAWEGSALLRKLTSSPVTWRSGLQWGGWEEPGF